MTRPLLLDLFCGAGGAAMGYHRAGFDIIGVDIEPQPRYPFPFIQADALLFLQFGIYLHGLKPAAIHASPPCQDHSRLRVTREKVYGTKHLLGATLDLLAAQPLPWVVENVNGATVRAEMARRHRELLHALRLHVRPGVAPRRSSAPGTRRHRLFATTIPMLVPGSCTHYGENLDVSGHNMQGREYKRRRALGLPFDTLADRRVGMGIDWMSRDELSESIPPAFTEYIGASLLAACEVAA